MGGQHPVRVRDRRAFASSSTRDSRSERPVERVFCHQTCYAADRRLKPMDPATLRVIYGILAVVLLVLIILTRRKRLGR